MTDPLEVGPGEPSDADASFGALTDAEDELLAAQRAGDARREAQRQDSSAVRRARFAAVAPWVVVALLAVAGAAAGVAGLEGGGSNLPVPQTGAAAELPVIQAAIPSDAAPGGATGVAVSGDRVYVAESHAGFVRVTTRDGSAVATIGAGWLRTPVYVAVGPVDGRVYVSDRGRGEVAVFSATGERLGAVHPPDPSGAAANGVWSPLALGFAPDGVLYVADSVEPQSVDVFSATGARVATLGAGVPDGRTGRRFAFPNGIAANADEVFVADSNNGRLLVFDRSGTLLRQVAVDGIPRGIAMLGDGRIVVVDASSNSVSVLDAQGHVLGTIPGEAGDGTTLGAPAGVALGEDGTLYVVDSVSGRVFTAKTTVAGVGRSGFSTETRSWLLAAAALLWVIAVGLGWRATVRARARAREQGIRL